MGMELNKGQSLDQLAFAVSELTDTQAKINRFILVANDKGASTSEIGDALGISKQSAHARLKRLQEAGK